MFLEHNANAGAYAHMWDLKDAYRDDILVYIAPVRDRRRNCDGWKDL